VWTRIGRFGCVRRGERQSAAEADDIGAMMDEPTASEKKA